jgi:rfaE bifunctional protein kinase chain/domain
MSNPLVPDDRHEPDDGEAAKDSSAGQSSLSYQDVLPLEAQEQAAKNAQQKQESRPDNVTGGGGGGNSTGTASTIPRAPFTYYMGQKPQYQMRQSEFLSSKIEQSSVDLKPLVDKFLKETPGKDEHKLNEADQRELEQTRESLAKFTSTDDALKTALQLAKLYQHLRCIEEAKKATDLSLGIDPESSTGRELFKELEHLRPAGFGLRYGATPGLESLTKSNLRKRIQELAAGKVIVLGDMIVDEFLEGKPERISREAPILILEHVDTELILGGAANAAHNVASLGGECRAIGVCGRDNYAAKLAELFEKAGITQGLVQDPSRPTTVKTRVLSKSHSFKQQLLRIDRMCHDLVSKPVESQLVDRLQQASAQFAALILSDYRGGILTDGIVKACLEIAKTSRLKVVVDAQDRLERFQQVTSITPNEPDAELAVGFKIDSDDRLRQAGERLLQLTGAESVLITRGARGMTLFERGRPAVSIPAFNRSEVFDVTGAGDTVTATMTLALVTGCSFAEGMALGNLAAGVVVKKTGTATINQEELLEALEDSALPE